MRGGKKNAQSVNHGNPLVATAFFQFLTVIRNERKVENNDKWKSDRKERKSFFFVILFPLLFQFCTFSITFLQKLFFFYFHFLFRSELLITINAKILAERYLIHLKTFTKLMWWATKYWIRMFFIHKNYCKLKLEIFYVCKLKVKFKLTVSLFYIERKSFWEIAFFF